MEDEKKPLLTALATLFADVDAKIQNGVVIVKS